MNRNYKWNTLRCSFVASYRLPIWNQLAIRAAFDSLFVEIASISGLDSAYDAFRPENMT